MQWGKGRVRDWIPRPVLDKMKPGQGEGRDTKTGIGRTGGRTGSVTGFKAGIERNAARAWAWTVYQGPYRTKRNQDKVRY